MFSVSFTMLLSFGAVVILIACSRYREWLLFLFAGMGFWAGLELLRELIQMLFEMSLLHGYVSALMVFLVGVAITLAIKDHNELKRQHRKNVKYIEHTPVYEDEPHQYSG